MGREQELIQAVKNGDVPGVQKLVAKIKASKSSEYLGTEPWAPSPGWAFLPVLGCESQCWPSRGASAGSGPQYMSYATAGGGSASTACADE